MPETNPLAFDKTVNGFPISSIVHGMSREEIDAYLVSQFVELTSQHAELVVQYKELVKSLDKNNDDIVDRVENILSLMSSNMAFIKQMIYVEENTNSRLNEQEKLNAKQELNFSSLVDRQNRLAQAINNMNKNTKLIMTELEKVKANEQEHDKFRTRIAIFGTIGVMVIGWLLSGDNLARLILFVQNMTNAATN